MPDPFASALRNWRPGTRPAGVSRDDPAVADAPPTDDWGRPPDARHCPTWQRLPRGACVWHLDAFGTPRQLLDAGGRVEVVREEAELERVVKAMRVEYRT